MLDHEYRAVLKHFFLEGITPKEGHERLVAVHRDRAPSDYMVKKWFKSFRMGDMSTDDAPRSGRPKTATDDDHVEKAKQLVLADRRIKLTEIAEKLKISTGSADTIVTQILGFRKVITKWVPRILRDDQKACRVELSKVNLELLNRNPKDFWYRYVTVDETWIHHYIPEDAHSSKRWTGKGEQLAGQVRHAPSAGKVMATVFWDVTGIIHIEYMLKGTTITGESYATLLEKVAHKLRESRSHLQRKTIILHHDNAPAHKSAKVTAKIEELGIRTLPHPPYSPDLAPSDYFLFGSLKNFLAGNRFSSEEEVIYAVNDYFRTKTSDYFSAGIKALPDRWIRCIELLGDYVE